MIIRRLMLVVTLVSSSALGQSVPYNNMALGGTHPVEARPGAHDSSLYGLAPQEAPGGTWHDVKALGAAGNGSSDDTSALNRAIQGVNSHGGIAYFPPGVFKTTATLTPITNPQAEILCARGAVIEGTTPSDVLQINAWPEEEVQRGPLIMGCTFKTTSTGTFIHSLATIGIRILDNMFIGKGNVGIDFENAHGQWTERTIVQHNAFYNCSKGIRGIKTTGTVSFEDNDWTDNQFQIFSGQVGISIERGALLYNSRIGFYQNSNGTSVQAITGGSIQSSVIIAEGEGSSCTVFSTDTGNGSSITASGFSSVNGCTLSVNSVLFSPLIGDINVSEGPYPADVRERFAHYPAFFPGPVIASLGNRFNGPLAAGTSLMADTADGITNLQGAVGFNMLYNGTQYVTGASSLQNGAALIGLTGTSSPVVKFYLVPATGFSNQTLTPRQLASDFAMSVSPDTITFKSGVTWTNGSGPPKGGCTNGSLYSNTSGGRGSTLYVCVSGSWENVK